MDENLCLPPSPELMSAADTGLLVIDVQEKLVRAIADAGRVVLNVRRLIEAARILGLPVIATEHRPQDLGPTVSDVGLSHAHDQRGHGTPAHDQRGHGTPVSRSTFSCGGCPGIFGDLERRGIGKLLLCGVETHVAVQQTALDLLAAGWRVYVAVDAVGSRRETDCRTALGRMDSAGATLTTTEAALFEWCLVAGTPEFNQISRLLCEERAE